jgi:hypothetical protein
MFNLLVASGDFQYDLSVGGGTWKNEISWEIYEVCIYSITCAHVNVEVTLCWPCLLLF